MGLWLLRNMLVSLLLTILLEEFFAVIVGVRNRRDLLLLCAVNVLTNPVVVFLYYLTAYCTALNTILITILLELMAITVEAIYYKSYGRGIKHPVLLSVGANLFSYGTGRVISYLSGI